MRSRGHITGLISYLRSLFVQLWPGGDIRIAGGIVAGDTSTDPAAGEIHYADDLRPVRGGTTYTAYPFVPVNPPGTNASWDGDSKATGDYTLYASDFGLPNTAKAIKIYVSVKWSAASDSYYCIACYYNTWNAFGGTASKVANIGNEFICDVPLDSNGRFTLRIRGANATYIYIRATGYYI